MTFPNTNITARERVASRSASRRLGYGSPYQIDRRHHAGRAGSTWKGWIGVLNTRINTGLIPYIGNEGFRTADLSLSSKAINQFARGENWMVGPDGQSSNHLFETLEEWNTEIESASPPVFNRKGPSP